MHIDWQQIGAMTIVAGAAASVGWRVWKQVAAFQAKPGKAGGSGCDGCASNRPESAKAAPALVQIQMRPPAHLHRPKSE